MCLGHFSEQTPHPVHFSGSITARFEMTDIACDVHAFAHIPHPMQEMPHAFEASAPLSLDEQPTVKTDLSAGSRRMSFLGHFSAQAPHPTHFSESIAATPFLTEIAPYTHALAQLP